MLDDVALCSSNAYGYMFDYTIPCAIARLTPSLASVRWLPSIVMQSFLSVIAIPTFTEMKPSVANKLISINIQIVSVKEIK